MHISVFDDDHYMPIEFLSSGTIEQIYLAERDATVSEMGAALSKKDAEIAILQAQLAALNK